MIRLNKKGQVESQKDSWSDDVYTDSKSADERVKMVVRTNKKLLKFIVDNQKANTTNVKKIEEIQALINSFFQEKHKQDQENNDIIAKLKENVNFLIKTQTKQMGQNYSDQTQWELQGEKQNLNERSYKTINQNYFNNKIKKQGIQIKQNLQIEDNQQQTQKDNVINLKIEIQVVQINNQLNQPIKNAILHVKKQEQNEIKQNIEDIISQKTSVYQLEQQSQQLQQQSYSQKQLSNTLCQQHTQQQSNKQMIKRYKNFDPMKKTKCFQNIKHDKRKQRKDSQKKSYYFAKNLFQCQFCSKSYRYKKSLETHMKLYHQKYLQKNQNNFIDQVSESTKQLSIIKNLANHFIKNILINKMKNNAYKQTKFGLDYIKLIDRTTLKRFPNKLIQLNKMYQINQKQNKKKFQHVIICCNSIIFTIDDTIEHMRKNHKYELDVFFNIKQPFEKTEKYHVRSYYSGLQQILIHKIYHRNLLKLSLNEQTKKQQLTRSQITRNTHQINKNQIRDIIDLFIIKGKQYELQLKDNISKIDLSNKQQEFSTILQSFVEYEQHQIYVKNQENIYEDDNQTNEMIVKQQGQVSFSIQIE